MVDQNVTSASPSAIPTAARRACAIVHPVARRVCCLWKGLQAHSSSAISLQPAVAGRWCSCLANGAANKTQLAASLCCVSLVPETRPCWCTGKEVQQLMVAHFTATRLQIGMCMVRCAVRQKQYTCEFCICYFWDPCHDCYLTFFLSGFFDFFSVLGLGGCVCRGCSLNMAVKPSGVWPRPCPGGVSLSGRLPPWRPA